MVEHRRDDVVGDVCFARTKIGQDEAKQINNSPGGLRTAVVERIGTPQTVHGPKLVRLAILAGMYLVGLSRSNSF